MGRILQGLMPSIKYKVTRRTGPYPGITFSINAGDVSGIFHSKTLLMLPEKEIVMELSRTTPILVISSQIHVTARVGKRNSKKIILPRHEEE
mmetsp:Transcript_46053/g.72786  ORF Transcript_46053/g.72786 Transcript_46053/m.72786 type:complete len:92 (-) Transcript_46053:1488-1763(-)